MNWLLEFYNKYNRNRPLLMPSRQLVAWVNSCLWVLLVKSDLRTTFPTQQKFKFTAHDSWTLFITDNFQVLLSEFWIFWNAFPTSLQRNANPNECLFSLIIKMSQRTAPGGIITVTFFCVRCNHSLFWGFISNDVNFPPNISVSKFLKD